MELPYSNAKLEATNESSSKSLREMPLVSGTLKTLKQVLIVPTVKRAGESPFQLIS